MDNGNMPAMPLNQPEIWSDPTNPNKGTVDAHGLTKREEFSGRIMANIAYDISDRCRSEHFEYAAEMAVDMADALLKELSK